MALYLHLHLHNIFVNNQYLNLKLNDYIRQIYFRTTFSKL